MVFRAARHGIAPHAVRDLDDEEIAMLMAGLQERERINDRRVASIVATLRNLWTSETVSAAYLMGEEEKPSGGLLGAYAAEDALREREREKDSIGWLDGLDDGFDEVPT